MMNARNMMLRISINVALALSLSMALAGDAGTDLRGRVLRPDGQPASGATVYYYRYGHRQPTRCGVQGTVRTDADGRFRLAGMSAQPIEHVSEYLVAVAPGYGLACWSSSPRDDKEGNLVLRLTKEAAAKGTVTDVSGKPVPRAAVAVTSVSYGHVSPGWRTHFGVKPWAPIPELVAETNALGRFSIPHLAAASGRDLRLHVFHKSYAAANKWLSRYERVGAIGVVLEPGGAITGRVTHASTGKPAAGISVLATGRGPSKPATTGADGRYAITNLRSTTYDLECLGGTNEQWTARPHRNVEVAPGETTENVDFVLVRGGIVCGKVLETAAGAPLAGVSVSAVDDVVRRSVGTATDGSFRMRVPSGSYAVSAYSYGIHYRPDGSEALTAVVIDGQRSAPLTIELTRGLSLVGTVLGPGGQPVAEAEVTVDYRGRRPSVRTDQAGRFQLDGIVPNRPVVVCTVQMDARLGAFTRLDIGSQPPKDVEIRVVPMVAITGRVVDHDGAPTAGVHVNLTANVPGSGGGSFHALSREDGRYEIFAPPGVEYQLYTRALAPSSVRTPAVSATAGKRHRARDVVVTRRRISGRALGPTGAPVPRTHIRLMAGCQILTTFADAKGAFRFPEVEIGDKGCVLITRSRDKALVARTPFRPSDAGREALVQLARSARVIGRVVNEDGHSIPGATVSLALTRPNDGAFLFAASVRSGPDGRFVLTEAIPGAKASVCVGAEGYGFQNSEAVLLRGGETADVGDIGLPRADSFVAGHVVDQDGRPLAGIRISCDGKGVHKQVYTGPQGRYRVKGLLRKGKLRVTASSSEYGSKSRGRVRPGSDAVDFVIRTKKREPWAWFTRLFGGKQG